MKNTKYLKFLASKRSIITPRQRRLPPSPPMTKTTTTTKPTGGGGVTVGAFAPEIC